MKNYTQRSLVKPLRFLKQRSTSGLTAMLLLATMWSQAQSLTNSLRIERTFTNLQLNYSLASSNGAFFFLQNNQLDGLFSGGQVIASGIAASNPVGTVVVPFPTNTLGFFDLFQDPTLSVSPSDFTSIDDGDVPQAPATLLLESSNLPAALSANSAFLVSFQISDTNGNVVLTNGQIALSLENGDETSIAFAYTLLPASVGVTNGIGQVSLTIQTTNSLGDSFLAGKFSGQTTGQFVPRLQDATAGSLVGHTAVSYANYSDPNTVNWRYPLPAVVALSGAFGEWPGHSDLHYGIDFAATAGTSVLAAKKGVVVENNGKLVPNDPQTEGHYIAIYHGNGYVTRYLHINSNVGLGSVVTNGQVIGTVHDWTSKHLHFEMLQLNNPSFYTNGSNYRQLYQKNYRHSAGNFPGMPVNPIANPAFTFTSTLFTSGGQTPVIPAVYFRSSPPATTILFMDPANPSLERLSDITRPSPVYVILQVVEQAAGHLIPPKQITFTPDVGSAENITYGLTATNIDSLRPATWTPAAGPGYALLPSVEASSGTAATYKSRWYKYWFGWDTSVYANGPLGQHSFTVQAKDLAGNAASPVVLIFGPHILTNGQPLVVSQGQTPLTIPIDFKFGPLPNGPLFANRIDTCQCTISVTPTTDWDVQFLPTSTQTSRFGDDLSFDIFADDQQVPVTVQVTPLVSNPAIGTLILTAQSFVLPGIHDQVTIPIQPPLFGAVISSVTDVLQDDAAYGGPFSFTNVTVMATNIPTLALAESGFLSHVNGSANYQINAGGNIFTGSLLADASHSVMMEGDSVADSAVEFASAHLDGSFSISAPSKILVSGSLILTAGAPYDVGNSIVSVQIYGLYQNQSVNFGIGISSPGTTNFNVSFDAPAGSYDFTGAAYSQPQSGSQNYTNAAMVHIANQFSITIAPQ